MARPGGSTHLPPGLPHAGNLKAALVAADDPRCPVSHGWRGIAAPYRRNEARSRSPVAATVVRPSVVSVSVRTPVLYSVTPGAAETLLRALSIACLPLDGPQVPRPNGSVQISSLRLIPALCPSNVPPVLAKFASADLSENENLLLFRSGSCLNGRTATNERAGRENTPREESRADESRPDHSHVSPPAEQHGITDKLPIDSSW